MTRRPLNPCDYFLLMLDEGMRRDGLAGNTCVLRLRMEDVPSEGELRRFWADLTKREPVLTARLEFSAVLRRPRWAGGGEGEVPVRPAKDLEAIVNAPLDPRTDPPVEAYRLEDGVAIRWHHALMDAKGCERLLAGESSEIPKGREYERDRGLDSWWARFRMSLRMRRMLQEIDGRRPANFDHEPKPGPKRFGVRTDTFDVPETAAVFDRAASLCGAFQRNLYLLAATCRALDASISDEGPLVIPLPVNLRKREWSPIVANYLTFFHFVVPRDRAGDLSSVIRLLKESHVEQIRRRNDRAMIALLHLGRHLSLPRYLRETGSREGRERVTAYFSFPGESPVREFLGRPVTECRSFPGVPARPGIGVFFSLSGGRLLLTTVFVRENVEEARVAEFVGRLRDTL